jgi:hypothetical protein
METITPTIRPTPKQELAWEKLQDLTTRFLLFGVTKVEFIKRLSSLRPMKHQLRNGEVVFAGEAVAYKRKFLQGIAFSKMCKNSGCSSAQL